MSWLIAQFSWETVAVITSVAYVILAARENIWCWFFALITTSIYTIIFWNVSLLMESALNVYYLAMAVYGWWQWNRPEAKDQIAKIHQWPLRLHLPSIAGIILISATSGWLLNRYTSASLPYLDSLTTWAAVFTTWLVAKKVLENWLYWIVINSVSIYLYFTKELYQTVILFVLFVILAVYGWFSWRRKHIAQAM